MKLPRFLRLAAASLALALAGAVHAQAWAWDDGTVPFVVSPEEIVDRMLRMGQVEAGDTLLDLGSGDGRIVIEAARRGARGLGVDLDPTLVALATENARRAGVSERARFEARDLFDTDLSGASVITMYLLPDVNAKLLPRLLALKPGTRIVSHDGGIGDWPHDEMLEMRVPEKSVGVGGLSRVQLWIVPARAAGRWRVEVPGYGADWSFRIGQTFQQLDIAVHAAGREMLVRANRLRGAQIKMSVTGMVNGRAANHLFAGTIEGDRMHGDLRMYNSTEERIYPWTATRNR